MSFCYDIIIIEKLSEWRVADMNYCVSDIHGDWNKYQKMFDTINLGKNDTLYVMGDVVDRGKHGLKILLDMKKYENIVPIIGNHDYYARKYLKILLQRTIEIHEKGSVRELDREVTDRILAWSSIGGQQTLDEFMNMSFDDQKQVLEYPDSFLSYKEIVVKGKTFVLFHAGIKNYIENKPLTEYSEEDFIFILNGHAQTYFTDDRTIIAGNTPISLIKDAVPSKIYYKKNYIDIDCGAGFGSNLGVLRLEDMKEFYID